MRRLVATVGLISTVVAGCAPSMAAARPTPAPPLPADARRWIGSPLSWADLRGKVVLLDVWTFG